MVLDDDAALGDAGGAAGLEDVGGILPDILGEPAAHRTAAQPVVLEQAELAQVIETLDFLAWIEIELEERVLALHGIDPEGGAELGVEVPGDDLAHVGVEFFFGLCLSHAHQECSP